KKVLFYQDNVPSHKSTVAMTKLYSPDLAPCDFFLFPNLKTWFDGKKFSNEKVIVNEYFTDFETAFK
ncbi:hypothetical protein ALC53_08226, partial [Atta colombica]